MTKWNICPGCGMTTSGVSAFCPKCGEAWTVQCPDCGITWRFWESHQFCPNCGAAAAKRGVVRGRRKPMASPARGW